MQKMIILLILITIGAWCADVDTEIEIPSSWVKQTWNGDGGTKTVRSPLALGLNKLRVWPDRGKEVTFISDSAWHLQCEVLEGRCNAGSTLFKIFARCQVCEKQHNAFVFLTQPQGLPRSQYRLTIVLPNENTRTYTFNDINIKQTHNACAYHAREDRFSVTRFVPQYSEESQLCVRMTFCYSDFNHVVVNWGTDLDHVEDAEQSDKREDLYFICCPKPPRMTQPRFGIPLLVDTNL